MAAADGDRWLRVPEAVRYHNVFCPSRHGPVAQLGARLNGIQEVTGSIPVRSTNLSNILGLSKPNLRVIFSFAYNASSPA